MRGHHYAIARTALCVLALLAPPAAAEDAPRFDLPVACPADAGCIVRSFVDEDPVLTLLDEETARASVAILLEGHALDRQVEDVSADNDANEAE